MCSHVSERARCLCSLKNKTKKHKKNKQKEVVSYIRYSSWNDTKWNNSLLCCHSIFQPKCFLNTSGISFIKEIDLGRKKSYFWQSEKLTFKIFGWMCYSFKSIITQCDWVALNHVELKFIQPKFNIYLLQFCICEHRINMLWFITWIPKMTKFYVLKMWFI